jgi:PAS domain S-box-containing protein
MREERDILQEELRTRAEKLDAEVFLRVEAVEASRQLAESERRYHFLVDAVPQLLWTARADGSVDFSNARWSEYTHLTPEQLRGDGWHQALHPEDRARTLGALAEAVRIDSGRYYIEHRIRSHDGTYRWMLTNAVAYRNAQGQVLQWLGTTTDIHDRVTAEEKLLQAERLQAVGKLAGGVAHEVNNMMTVVIGCAKLALEALGPDHEQRAEFGEIIRAAARASDVTRQLLAYSRQQVLSPTVVDLNQVVGELTSTLKRLIGSDRELAVSHRLEEARVKADRGQLEQVLINLAANARDATEADGLVRIEIDVVQLDENALASYLEAESLPGEYARIAVGDNGAGMPPEVAARVFEPFFTTKAIGEGTGLGLSMVYGIVKQSGGFVKIDSKPGEGTVVTVHFPLVGDQLTAVPAVPSISPGSGELILVVEDEPQVRAILRRALQSHGYVVQEAPTGAAALAFLSKHPEDVRLVLTDIVMPHTNGQELAHRLRDEHPDVPVLFMSGYGGDDIRKRGLTLEGSAFLQKPFAPEVLCAQVSKLMRAQGLRSGVSTEWLR